MINRKTFFFHFRTTFNTPWLQKKKFDFSWTTTLTALRSWEKCFFFISLGRSRWKYLLTWSYIAHYITNLSKKFPNGILPVKNMCNLKIFFLRNFSGVLHDLLPILLEEVARFVTFINLVKSYYFCPFLFSWISELTYFSVICIAISTSSLQLYLLQG